MTVRLRLDVSTIHSHRPLFPNQVGGWYGVGFGQRLGIWLHSFVDVRMSYNTGRRPVNGVPRGFLTEFSSGPVTYFDLEDEFTCKMCKSKTMVFRKPEYWIRRVRPGGAVFVPCAGIQNAHDTSSYAVTSALQNRGSAAHYVSAQLSLLATGGPPTQFDTLWGTLDSYGGFEADIFSTSGGLVITPTSMLSQLFDSALATSQSCTVNSEEAQRVSSLFTRFENSTNVGTLSVREAHAEKRKAAKKRKAKKRYLRSPKLRK